MWEVDTVGNGNAEEIEFGGMTWMVLDQSTDGSKKLLLCKDDFYCDWLPEDYDWQNESGRDYVWEASGVRAFLNGQYISDHFSEDESARICETKLDNKGNPFGDEYDCSATIDKVFMLSLDEAVRYFAANSSEVEQYCLLEGQLFYTRTPLNHEWSCSPIRFVFEDFGESISVEHNDEIHEVYPDISFLAFGFLDAWTDVTESDINVRPAMWVKF